LFFDLVYVFAIGELSNHLLAHVDLRTGAETAVLALAVFYAWYMVAWGANWLDPDAFGDRAWLFVTGYLLLQIGRAGFLIVACGGGRRASTSSTTSSGSCWPASVGWRARSHTATHA
jgi:low temperature requirement protein LtrA